MIKLIVTDIDDTIIEEGSRDLNPEYPEMVRKFREKGLIVVAASGRQKPSIKKTFASVKDQLIFLADNGTDIESPDFATSVPFEEADYMGLIKDMKELSNDYQIMSCMPDCAYIEEKDQNYFDHMVNSYGYVAKLVDNVANIKGICKVSLYNKNGIEPSVEKMMQEKWSDKMDVCLAGELFLDFMPKDTNKGSALKMVQEHYGITSEETVAFGNADNDIPMLKRAKYSYAVANGSEKIRAIASEVIGEMKEDAVLGKMKEIYKNL
jgi:Cof subfamily protein (haloacid dehalogenase superfamily)